MKSRVPAIDEGDLSPPGPYDGAGSDEPWFLDGEEDQDGPPLPRAAREGLVDAAGWHAAEAACVAELGAAAFDAGRLAERLRRMGAGAAQRLALEEATALSWWTGDRVGADRLALWLSYRIGAAEEGGEGLIRTAWAARRLMAPASSSVAAAVAELLGDRRGGDGREDSGFAGDVAGALKGVAGCSPLVRGCAAFHLWRSLDERPDHLRGLESAILGARMAGQGGMGFLPLALTGFGALTGAGSPERRLVAWVEGAHRSVLAALMMLDRLDSWRERAVAETADMSGRTPARLIAALAAVPMLGAAQAVLETGASRAAVLRNLDQLMRRGLVREVTGHGRFRVWAAKASGVG